MALPDWKLNLLTFPQRWDGPSAQLHLKVAVLPRTNPLESLYPRTPPMPDEPAFVKASLALNAMLIPSLERLPDPADVTDARSLGITTPTDLEDLYQELATHFPLHPSGTTLPAPEPRRAGTYMNKFLPRSYRRAFAFEAPRTRFAHVDDTYHCALKTPASKPPAPTPTAVSWGQVLAVVLQQPRLAERLGLVYSDVITLPSNTFFEEGGWLYIALAPTSDYVSLAPPASDQVKYYAARIPALKAGEKRPLFASVLFPVLSGPPPASYDENFLEAEAYDDGFAKIVHADQPATADVLDDSTSLPPVQDAGIALGWDDEQLTIWMNRQIDPAFAVQDSPTAVAGYRVDVRKEGVADWTSLARVRGRLRLGTLIDEQFVGDHGLKVAPIQLHSQRTGDYWLPSYFARWTGQSLVAIDALDARLKNPAAPPPTWTPVGLDNVPLKYGEPYQFRVRLSDIAGGGPHVDETPQNPAPNPIETHRFRRFVPPKAVRIVGPLSAPDPDDPQTTYDIARPLLGHPALMFTAVSDPESKLLADAPTAHLEGREIGYPDPDVTTLEIVVEVRDRPIEDTSAFRSLYVTTRPFPDDLTEPLLLELTFKDEKNVAAMGPPAETGPLKIPTARDIRLRLTPICRVDPTLKYFGSQEARRGTTIQIATRAHSFVEHDLFVPQEAGTRLRAIMLQADPPADRHHGTVQAVAGHQQEAPADLAQRLGQQLRLEADGLTFFGRTGRRVVFGCSPGLRHVLSPDYSSMTFASKSDLVRQWIPVIHLQLDRDWTWDALADISFEITREVKNLLTGDVETAVAGTIEVRRSISPSARREGDMTQTDLFFFDAIDPKPQPPDFPSELDVRYKVQTSFKNAPDADEPPTLALVLPIASAPAQTPKLVSAGIALSPYQRADDYSSTAARRRMLWLEFAEPIQNAGRNTFFARVLAYAPDPVLTEVPPAVPPVPLEPPLPVDPELIRVITPKQSDDRAGLDAMQPLIASHSPVHFLVPLPPGTGELAPELFGFFVYEIRVGHVKGWSTAQARFGPPLRVSGVQHPAPPLVCQVARQPSGVSAAAGYATPVSEGRNLLPRSPKTEIWGLLYAQVTQIDHADRRNVLLARRHFRTQLKQDVRETFNVAGTGYWDQSEIEALLNGLALPKDSPLSVLAVELFTQLYPAPDPLGANLGDVRILRTSPLISVPPVCA